MIKRSLRRAFSFLFRLQWKLTIAYTLVTVLVVTILMFTTIFFSGLMSFNMPQVTLLIAQGLYGATPRLVPALETSPVDEEAVQHWIDASVSGSNVVFDNSDSQEVTMSFSTVISGDSALAVLDPQGRVIRSSSTDLIPPGTLISKNYDPEVQQLIARVLNGEEAAPRLIATHEQHQIAVAPIKNEARDLLGIAVLIFHGPSWSEMAWISLRSTIPAVLVVSVVAALIGSLFGALTARSLTRRLSITTRAAVAWGAGNFSVRINDRSDDEIGQLARDLNRMADRFQELMLTRQELAALEERNRLARDLHDSAKQQVFATSMNLAAARALWERNPEEAHKRVEIAAELARQSQQELTGLIQTLRPSQLDHTGLTKAMYEMCQTWHKQHNINVNFLSGGDEPNLPAELEQALFRVAQEALSNVARHSAASGVELALTHTSEVVIMEIKDNGSGFDTQQPVRGLGLRSMQERVSALGGSFSITSDTTGTSVIVRVPVKIRSIQA